MRWGALLWLLVGCDDKSGEYIPPEESDADADADTDADTDADVDTGTDEDGDGFTVEEGDCDDTDPWINPALDEEAGDGKDNDCDGRTDEAWAGLTAALVEGDGAGSLVRFDTLGNIEDTLG